MENSIRLVAIRIKIPNNSTLKRNEVISGICQKVDSLNIRTNLRNPGPNLQRIE